MVPWIWVDIQSFLYNKVLRFNLEGSLIFVNLDLPRYKELEIGIWPGWLLEGAEKTQTNEIQKAGFLR